MQICHFVCIYSTDSISADIKLETENEEGICSEDAPTCLSDNVYHPRVALKNAINEWLPEFYISKDAWGPITKPHPIQTSECRLTNFYSIMQTNLLYSMEFKYSFEQWSCL